MTKLEEEKKKLWSRKTILDGGKEELERREKKLEVQMRKLKEEATDTMVIDPIGSFTKGPRGPSKKRKRRGFTRGGSS